MRIRTDGGDFSPGDRYSFEVFDGPDLGGPRVYTFGPIGGTHCGNGGLGFLMGLGASQSPALQDELFSVRLSAPTGPYRLDDLHAYERANGVDTIFVRGVPMATDVPEPGTAAPSLMAPMAPAPLRCLGSTCP